MVSVACRHRAKALAETIRVRHRTITVRDGAAASSWAHVAAQTPIEGVNDADGVRFGAGYTDSRARLTLENIHRVRSSYHSRDGDGEDS